MLKLTNIICTFISAALWLAGIYLCIKGAYTAGLPYILLAILSGPPSELLVSKLTQKKNIKKGILIGRNSAVIIATAAILLFFNSRGYSPETIYRSIRNTESPMAQGDTTYLTSEGVSPGTNPYKKDSHVPDIPESNLHIEQGSPITDNAFNLYDKVKSEIEKSAEEGKRVIDKMADRNPFPDKRDDGDDNGDNDTDKPPKKPEPDEDTENKINLDGLEIHFIDVGQGDAALILCNNEAILIDAGIDDIGTKLQAYLKKRGVKKLNALILTHPDADHIGSADVILTKFEIEQVFMPEYEKDTYTYRNLIDTLAYKGIEPIMPEIGSTYSVGEANYTILAPLTTYEDANNSSIVLKLEHGNNSFLFTGDAAIESETDMIASGADLTADVLKVGHHGSKYSTSQEFVNAVSPTYALISCAEKNEYFHPHAAALNNLRTAGVKLYRTDEQGTIVVYSDKNSLTFNCAPYETWKTGS